MPDIYYKTEDEISLIKESCRIIGETLAEIAKVLKPGMTGLQIDKIAEDYIRSQNADPAFKGFHGFPASICVSVNEQVVHGIPNKIPFEVGDIVSVDCGVKKNGFYGDSAFTFAIGEISNDLARLLTVTKESLYKGIEAAVVGSRVGDIGFAVQQYAEVEHGFGIVRDLVGHGLGRSLHEPPEIPNYGRRGKGVVLREGLVIAIEPMVNLGVKDIKHLKDGWTIVTKDELPSAHYEHTLVLTKEGPITLSDHSLIEEEIKKNENLVQLIEKSSIFAPRN